MMTKLVILFVFFVAVPNTIVAQERLRKGVKGKVVAGSNDLDGIHIVNLQSKEEVETLKDGCFSIAAVIGDTLMISAIQFKAKKVRLTDEDLSKNMLMVPLEMMMNPLHEVKVFQYSNSNVVSLGIISKNQKKYTPAERKLRTASDTGAKIGLNASMMLDPIWNAFSGRTAMLKKELIVERKEMLLVKIENLFEKEHFTNTLKIPAEYIKGFQYFIIENSSFVTILNTENKTLATFMMGELANKYLALIAIENK